MIARTAALKLVVEKLRRKRAPRAWIEILPATQGLCPQHLSASAESGFGTHGLLPLCAFPVDQFDVCLAELKKARSCRAGNHKQAKKVYAAAHGLTCTTEELTQYGSASY